MIQADSLTKKYGDHTAVDNLSFSIEPGEICGFLGPNGAGKTSTMRILAGFMPPTAGTATVAGFNVFTHAMEVKKRVGYLPESTPLYPDMRVWEYIDYVAELKGCAARSDRMRKVGDIMELTGVISRRNSLIGALSKGLRQRVGLAQALIGDPQVLILDEPTIGLDPKQIMEMRSLIKDLGGRRTVILSSHLLSEVQMVCTRAMIINKGKLVDSNAMDRLSGDAVNTVLVTLDGPGEQIRSELRLLPGVTEVLVRQDRPGTRDQTRTMTIEIHHKDDTNPRGDLVRLVASKGWDLIELGKGSVSLEDIYIKIITQDAGTSEEEKSLPGTDPGDVT